MPKLKNQDRPAKPIIIEIDGTKAIHMGLTKREHLAGLAMQAIISRGGHNQTEIAQESVSMADRLLTVLEGES